VKVTPNFDYEDFDCHSGASVPERFRANVADLCHGIVQPIRNKWGPVIVVSGYRDPLYNTGVGGALKSTHLTAEGADIRPLRFADVDEFIALIDAMHGRGELPALGGLGKYKGWAHVDLRQSSDGHLRRWLGKGVGSEPSE
jgi:uncharacterized protein YcbK (DUF882 family)